MNYCLLFKFYRSLMVLIVVTSSVFIIGCYKNDNDVLIHSGFKDFSKGRFDNGGGNLYVNANGIIETIHRLDVNNDGFVDLPLANSHDYIERGPTCIYSPIHERDKWQRRQLANDSGWLSRVVDLDMDGYADIIVVNGENGVTSVLSSYVYWGSADGISNERTELPTIGAYDVAVIDINHDGALDLIFPSAWVDHHNPGKPMSAKVYLAGENRKFEDATEKYAIEGLAAVSIAEADLNKDGYMDIVLANYRKEYEYDINSVIYWGTETGLDTNKPTDLPTSATSYVTVGDLNSDDMDDIIFTGADKVFIYWNRSGHFDPADKKVIEVVGYTSMFTKGRIGCDIADLDSDGINDLVMTTNDGLQIRSADSLDDVRIFLPLTNIHWVTASDLDNDERKDLIVSRYNDRTSYDCNSVVYWNSDSGFSVTNVTDFPTGGAVGNTAGDMNGDGKLEIIFNNTMSGHLKEIQNYIYLGNRDANYSPQNRIELPTDWCNGLAFADLDSDGYPETITIEVVPTKTGQRSYLRIYQGTPDGPLPDKFKEFMTNDGFASFAIADFNRDGYLDIFAVCQIYDDKPETLAKSGAIYYGSKDGFSENRFEIIETFGGNVHVADVDNNGYLDLICPDTRGYVLIYLGDKNGYSKNRCWNIPTSGMAFTGSPNTADLNGDGWLDLILTIPGHYMRIEDSLHIYYGSPNGYSSENSQKYLGGYSPLFAAVADYNNDGNLDVFLSAYSSPTTRVLPAKIFWGNGKKIDFEHPLSLMAESSVGALQVDLNRDGWIDLFVTCHRDDIGHQVNSLIFWNGPESFSRENVTLLPGLGPHSVHLSDNGNAYTRKPQESYISEPIRIAGSNIKNISWQADVPVPSKLKFQLRWAKTEDLLESAEWNGPQGNDTYYETSGQLVGEMKDARWIQYKAVFVSPYGCVSPRLSRVSFNYEKQSR